MRRLVEFFDDPYAVYHGDRGDWLVAYVISRDADLLAQVNFEVFIREFNAVGLVEDVDYAIERARHWACGWVDFLIVPPSGKAEKIANDLLAALEKYPCLDDELYSARAWEATVEFVSEISGSEKAHIKREFGLPEDLANDNPEFIQVVQQYLGL